MLMCRYDMQYFNTLPLSLGVELIRKVMQEKNRQQAWDIWTECYPHMDSKNFIPFDKFYNPQTTDAKSHGSTNDLLNLAKSIRAQIESGEYKQAT